MKQSGAGVMPHAGTVPFTNFILHLFCLLRDTVFDMKIKEWLQLLGFKPKPQTFDSVTKPLVEESYTHLKWSEWQHPKTKSVRPRFEDLEVLQQWIRPGDFVIDIGAHVGDTTLPYAHLVGKGGACLALEPNPVVFKILQENAELNKAHLNIIPLQAASAEKEEILKFSYNDPGLCNGGHSDCYSALERRSFYEVEVQGICLENYLNAHFANDLESLTFIKTDVEGYDFTLFKLHKPLIEKWRPALQVEVHKTLSEEEKRAFADAIKELGYTLYFVPGVTLSTMRPLSDRDLSHNKTFDLFATPH